MPTSVRYTGKTRRKLFRRSLRTRNRSKALRLARKWWLNMHDVDNQKDKDTHRSSFILHNSREKIRTPIVRHLSYTTPGHFALPEHSG